MFHRHKSLAAIGTAAIGTVLVLAAGCAEEVGDIDRTQPHKVKKSIFKEGEEWYVLQTVINPHWEGGIFTGFEGGFDRIKWEITGAALNAYRTYEFIKGGDGPGVVIHPAGYKGQLIASFPIVSHFDIQREYNPLTGEQTNVISENTTDRPWFERKYMRVNWSANVIGNFTFLDTLFQGEMTFYEHRYDNPEQWYLARREAGADGQTRWVRYYDDETDLIDDAEYMNVMNRIHFGTGGPVSGFEFDFRTSFLKVPPSTYQQFYYPDEVFEKFGYFRTERYTYDPIRGLTDFLDYLMNRWHIWERSADEQGRLIPEANRTVKPIRYWASPELYDPAIVKQPERMIDTTKLIVRGWNEGFKETVKHFQPQNNTDVYVFTDNDCRPENVLQLLRQNPRYLEGVHNDVWNIEGLTSFVDDPKAPTRIQGMLLSEFCDRMEIIDRLTPELEPAQRFAYQRLGDLRYPNLNYIGKAELGSPLGYGPSSADPVTGEIIHAAANIYGGALDGMRGYLNDLHDLLCASGELDDVIDAIGVGGDAASIRDSIEAQCFNRLDNIDIVTGENVRRYFQALGAPVFPPRAPQVFMPAPNFTEARMQGLLSRLESRRENFEQAKRMRHDRDALSMVNLKDVKGTYIEKMLITDDVLAAFGLDSVGANGDRIELTEEVLDKVSPLRDATRKHSARSRDVASLLKDPGGFRLNKLHEDVLSKNCILMPEAYSDVTVSRLLFLAHKVEASNEVCKRLFNVTEPRANGDMDCDGTVTRDETIDWVVDRVYRGVMEHEIGHTLGLRHNFAGSFDEEGYIGKYWEVIEQLPDVDRCAYGDQNGDGTVSAQERQQCVLTDEQYEVFARDRFDRRREQERAGIDMYQYASIMDYGGQFYTDTEGLGRYDLAAIKFGYGGLREVYNPADGGPNATRTNRVNVEYYLGGEICQTNEECDYSARGQTCGYRPDRSENVSWRVGVHPDLGHGFCSNWDLDQQLANVVVPVHHFCSDERTQDRPFCNRWDEGKTSLEIVENMIETYDRQYIFNNFRRYRLEFGSDYISRVNDRYFFTIAKQYQSMLWNVFYTPNFQFRERAGFNDQFTASITAMNFFGRILGVPDVGTYVYNPLSNLYERFSSDCETSFGDVDQLHYCLGDARRFYTSFETGYYGAISRLAIIGHYIDTNLALEALGRRYWGQPFANDETFPINYYDAFPEEMLALFKGMITQDATAYAALAPTQEQLQNGQLIEHRNFWTGGFFGNPVDGAVQQGTGIPARERTARRLCEVWNDGSDGSQPRCEVPRPMIEPPGSFTLPINALIDALVYFGVFYDTSFFNYLRITAYDPDQVRRRLQDNEVEYESPIFNRVYRAPLVSLDEGGEDAGITSTLVREALRAKTEYETVRRYGNNPPDDIVLHAQCQTRNQLRDDPQACHEFLIDWTRGELQRKDSFLNIAADLLKRLGLIWF